ncbi:MAG: phosphosulfolactate synthase [Acidimicrobiia bacterium]
MTSWSVGRLDRTAKPRRQGLTHVIDTGVPIEDLRGRLEIIAEYTDIWKFGFGTGYLDPTAAKKVQVLGDAGIEACVGGTLLEAAWLESKERTCLLWAKDMGFPCVEVSNGASGMASVEKRRLIELAAADFVVLSEVGSKDPADPVLPLAWAQEMAADLAAGATWGIAEGRESGTVGLYGPDGSVRWDVVESLTEAVDIKRVVFEAPRTSQQAAFIRAFGPNVSLGNIAPQDVLGLESLRRGLRADTLGVGVGPDGAQ